MKREKMGGKMILKICCSVFSCGNSKTVVCIAGTLLTVFRQGIEKKKSSLRKAERGLGTSGRSHCYNLHGQVMFAAGRLERLLYRLAKL